MNGMNYWFSWQRVSAMVLRYLFLMRNSWPRIIELIYWPTAQMLLWGFMTKFLMTNSAWIAQAAGVLITAVLLWDILFRGQLGVSLMFFEEMYARNLGHLFASPLRSYEMIVALMVMSLLRTMISFGGSAALAVPIFGFSVFSLGLPLAVFFLNLLINGWAIGLMVVGLVMRFGLGAESLAWVAIFAIAPITGIYYPVDTLPGWLQPVAHMIPASHVFEGMRALLMDQSVRYDLMANAFALNLLYMIFGVGMFLVSFRAARQRNLLLQVGE